MLKVLFNKRVGYFLALMLSIDPVVSFAKGGVSLGATRLIYPLGDKQSSISVVNSDEDNRFMIQSWVENLDGSKSKDFIITPPLFIMNKKSENTLRVIYSGTALPMDKESAYWLNMKAIPEVSEKSTEGKNVLQLAMLSKIKIFVRPKSLTTNSEDAYKELRFSSHSTGVKVENPTPYFVNMVNIQINGQELGAKMVPPKSTGTIIPTSVHTQNIRFSIVNDFGAIVAPVTMLVK